jgi:hypothetical protein
MADIPVRDLVRGGGVNKDSQANTLPLNTFSELIHARFTGGRVERIGDTELYQDSYSDPELLQSRAHFSITRSGADGHLLITSDSVFYDVGSGWIDVTPSYSVLGDRDEWACEQYGDSIIISGLGGEPLVLAPGAVEFVPFADWNPNLQAGKVFAYKNFLIAINIIDTGNVGVGLVIWSHPVLDGDAVNVEWTNLATNLAGANILADANSAILDGGVLADSAILYTDSTVWRMDATNAVLGLTAAVFNFRRIFEDQGILRPRCFVEVDKKHFVIGKDDIYVNDGIKKVSIVDERIARFFYGRLGTEGFAFVIHHPKPNEIIFAYAAAEFQQANEAFVFNYQYMAFTRWIFSENESFFKYLSVAALFDLAVESWETLPGTWLDYMTTTWNDLFPTVRTKTLFGLNVEEDQLYYVDTDTAYSVTPGTMVIERVDMDLKEVDGTPGNVTYLNRMIPAITGYGTCQIQFGGRNLLNEPIRWKNPVTYDIATAWKADARVSYRYLAIRITQSADEGFMSLTGYQLLTGKNSRR